MRGYGTATPSSRWACPAGTAPTGGRPVTTGPWNARPVSAACVACPFQSRSRWVETKRRWPELFAEAVETAARLRKGLAYVKEPYLHSLRMPLAKAVALDEGGQERRRAGRRVLGNECEGHCGV